MLFLLIGEVVDLARSGMHVAQGDNILTTHNTSYRTTGIQMMYLLLISLLCVVTHTTTYKNCYVQVN